MEHIQGARDMLIRLTRDVKNTTYDKRLKYGSESIATFKAGTAFLYTYSRKPGEFDFRLYAVGEWKMTAIKPKWSKVDIRDEIVAASEATLPGNAREAMAAEWHEFGIGAMAILDHIVKSGKMSVAEIQSISNAASEAVEE